MKPEPRREDTTPGPPIGGRRAIALGTDLAVGMAVFSALGYWMDRRSGGGVAWTLAGVFLGLAYGAYEVWKTVRGIESDSRARPSGADKDSADQDSTTERKGT